ncbi:hypothetical protein M8C21_008769, partial [Ambrosia artemisiifolia]
MVVDSVDGDNGATRWRWLQMVAVEVDADGGGGGGDRRWWRRFQTAKKTEKKRQEMSSTISRFISCAYSTLFFKPNEEYAFFKPVSIKPFLKNKKHARNLYGKGYKNLQYLSTFVRQSKVNPPPEDPSGSPSGSLRNWIVGIVLTFIIAFFSRNWGSLLLLLNSIRQ